MNAIDKGKERLDESINERDWGYSNDYEDPDIILEQTAKAYAVEILEDVRTGYGPKYSTSGSGLAEASERWDIKTRIRHKLAELRGEG